MSEVKKQVLRGKKNHFVVESCDELSDKRFNTAIRVYKVNKDTLELEWLSSNYRLDSAGWAGERVEAVKLLKEVYSNIKTENDSDYGTPLNFTIQVLY